MTAQSDALSENSRKTSNIKVHRMRKKNRACAGKSVLVVDDDEICRHVTAEILSNLGLHVDLAPDPTQAITLAQNTSYDLVLLDMRMPAMNGEQLARILLENNNATQDAIFLLTGEDGIADVVTLPEGFELGIVRKPLERAWVEAYFSKNAREKLPKDKDAYEGTKIEGFDTTRAIKNFMGYESAFFNILREFPDYGATFICEYASYLRTKNLKECQRLAHSIKGSSLMIGATEIHRLAKELETVCFSSTDIRQIDVAFRKIEEKIREASENVRNHFLQEEEQ